MSKPRRYRPLIAAFLGSLVTSFALSLPGIAVAQANTAQASTQASPNPTGSAASSLDVIVDGERHSWRPLEQGADVAWEAYRKGDYQAAVPVFARLAKLGHPVAEWLMGNVYFAGQGVPQDYRRALEWFEKAANQGLMQAYAPTAQLYEQGKGTPLDLGKAYMWYNIAIANLPSSVERYNLMKQRDTVGALMTQAQIEAAQKRSLLFQPKKVVPPDIETAREMLGE
ncbi:tetratricopeptide repeat protein [Dongia soli]|uniref:Tetratricopeptide repeat protein n=1 Tax=Dongia soli TaxID=600628 RepID=A0ABU5E5R9_9PROT|nr:tetratricopeptide repeat protein [Dongia soli]MDY0881389.1 tetratricopeptide repeat protein [Dongia soli]